MRTAIEWRRNLASYLACCDCGATELHLRLSEAEQWALTHPHEGETMTDTWTFEKLLPFVQWYYGLGDNGAGGSLHIVLDDGNTEREYVEWCIGWAIEHGDPIGAALAWALAQCDESVVEALYEVDHP